MFIENVYCEFTVDGEGFTVQEDPCKNSLILFHEGEPIAEVTSLEQAQDVALDHFINYTLDKYCEESYCEEPLHYNVNY